MEKTQLRRPSRSFLLSLQVSAEQAQQFADVQTIIHQFKALQQPDPDGHHERIACPTIILTGSEDGTHQNAFALKQGACTQLRVEGLAGGGRACLSDETTLAN